MTRMFKHGFNISCLDCHLHNALGWPRGEIGGTVLAFFGVPCPKYCPLCCRGAAWSFAPSLSCTGGVGTLKKNRWLGSCRRYVVMALALRWFQQWRLEAWGFYCLLCLNSWDLWKNTDSENFGITAPFLFCHLHVYAAVTLICCTTWIT